ncbi:MAG: hypothetical protein HY481_00615 [Candidatus Vogelbacteria bacterium]|nr:hypothetical protein [Candidatus Vogelbacteria bacterium]
MGPKGSEGLKIGLAGMIGCFLAVSLAWHWSGSAVIALLSLPVGFTAGWIAYAPLSFFAAFPRAWRRATAWRPPTGAGDSILYSLPTALALTMVNLGLVVTAPLVMFVPDSENTHHWHLLLIGLTMGLIIELVVVVLALADENTLINEPTSDRVQAKKIRKFNLRYNILTIPFFWIPLWLIKATLMIPAATVATVKGIAKVTAQTFAFLIRFVRALALITASNGRLTSGTAAALSYGICLWQNWPPIPGCLAGFLAGLGLWGMAGLALRFLPAPRSATVSA